MGKSYKVRRKVVINTRESLEYLEGKRGEKMQETLDRIGYRRKEEYRDCVSHLAW